MRLKNRKLGFTLIEIIISLGILTIIMPISFNIITSAIKEYSLFINKNTELNDLDNCLINIDNILRSDYITSIKTEEDSIEIDTKLVHDGKTIKKKMIYIKDSNLMVKTIVNDSLDTSVGNNILLKNVRDFNVLKKGELIYFEIITKGEEKRIRCI